MKKYTPYHPNFHFNLRITNLWGPSTLIFAELFNIGRKLMLTDINTDTRIKYSKYAIYLCKETKKTSFMQLH